MWSAAPRVRFCVAVGGVQHRAARAAKQTAGANGGLTLIEFVAIAVLAVVLGAIGGAVGTTVKRLRSVDRQLPLLATAQGLLAALPDRNALRHLNGLQRLLYDLEVGMPFLFVEQLDVQAPQTAGSAAADVARMHVQLAVAGEWRGAAR